MFPWKGRVPNSPILVLCFWASSMHYVVQYNLKKERKRELLNYSASSIWLKLLSIGEVEAPLTSSLLTCFGSIWLSLISCCLDFGCAASLRIGYVTISFYNWHGWSFGCSLCPKLFSTPLYSTYWCQMSTSLFPSSPEAFLILTHPKPSKKQKKKESSLLVPYLVSLLFHWQA